MLLPGLSSDGGWWQAIGIGIPVVVGVLRFVMTQFRVTGTQIELQRGLIGRKVLTARLDRVRAVEVVLHKPQAPIPLQFSDVAVVLARTSTRDPGDRP